MTGFTQTFTGNVVQPKEVSYSALAFSITTQLAWPLFAANSAVVSRIMECTPSAGSLALLMPSAQQSSVGSDVLFRNKGASAFTVQDSTGATIIAINPGIAIYLYLVDNSTVGGTWGVITFGAGSSAADPNGLAGAGLKAISATLNQKHTVLETAASVTLTDPSSRAVEYVWTSGAGNWTLPSAAAIGADFFFIFKNGGTGAVTFIPSGTDTVDGVASVQINPNESCFFSSNGQSNPNGRWYSVGLGRNVLFAFSLLVKSVAGGVDVTLTSNEASNKLITFTGTLTANINVIVPNQASPFFVYNNTNGAFSLTVKTAAGSGVVVQQGTRDILTCDAVNAYRAITNTAGTTAFIPGTAANPSITFIGDTTTGLFDILTGQLGIAALGTQVGLFTGTGLNATNVGATTAGTGAFTTLNASGNTTLAGLAVSGAFTAAAATLRPQVPIFSQVQDGTANYSVDTGAVNAIAATLAPAITAYAQGVAYWVKVGFTNTGTTTIQLNGIASPLAVVTNGGAALKKGQVLANAVHGFVYDGSNAVLLNPVDAGQSSISGNTTLTTATFSGTQNITATATVTLPAASTVPAGVSARFKSTTTGNVLLAPNGTDTIDAVNASVRIPSYDTWELESNGSTGWLIVRRGHWDVGDMKMQTGSTISLGWVAADASPLSQTTYAGLFAVIGTTWGAPGGGNFGAPDSRARMPIGTGQGNTAEGGGVGTNRVLGATAGAEKHTQTVGEIATHHHGSSNTGFFTIGTGGNTAPGGGTNARTDANTGDTGSSTPMDIMNPVFAVAMLVKT